MNDFLDRDHSQSIAIIGMAGRFPDAQNLSEFWQNLQEGRECIRTFSMEELLQAGVSQELLQDPNYVRARPYLEGIELFDHSFFGFTPREASIMDPQHRLLLETAWEAFENAGYVPDTLKERVSVYAGTGENGYLWYNLSAHRELMESMGGFPAIVGNGKDYLASRISYKLNLRGPSLTVQTACSSSLVAIHLGCQSLLSGESDLALAGAVSLALPKIGGYLYQPEGIVSSDGHCRSFDQHADGTLFGSGVGVVLLKRMEDALRDGDFIHGVLLGSALNNDGAHKVGYTAPGVPGQSEVILEALGVAGIEPQQVSYVEAHGSATRLGDPIELRALGQAYEGVEAGTVALGSVKTNIGHVNTAAGMAGLMKTLLGLQHQQIPASLNLHTPTPLVDWAKSPFYINTTLKTWEPFGGRRIAGVSSFGLGGTNAHVIVEEAPQRAPAAPSRTPQLLLFSGRSENAAQQQAQQLAEHLKGAKETLPDVAYTLQVGRKAFSHRRAVVAKSLEEAVQKLQQPAASQLAAPSPEVAWMFPGVGERYAATIRDLYDTEPVFRESLDHCCERLTAHVGLDLRTLLWQEGQVNFRDLRGGAAAGELGRTRHAQPALFAVEYSLAQLWQAWGIQPARLIGHSLGEYVAVTLAGVMSLPDALRVVALRAALIDQEPVGAMLAVPLSEQDILKRLKDGLSLAAVNAPALCVVSGTLEAVGALETELLQEGLAARRLAATHPFHSSRLEHLKPALLQLLQGVKLQAPEIPVLSNLTGNWLTENEACNPAYWAEHLCAPVRFSQGISRLAEDFQGILLEVGPAQSLSVFARQHLQADTHPVFSVLPHPFEQLPAQQHALQTLGKLWCQGVQIDWQGFYASEQRCRVPLPTYPFERQYHWIEPAKQETAVQAATLAFSESQPQQGETSSTPSLSNSNAEQQLLDLYSELLGIQNIRKDQGFFELGGHSLLAVQLISRIREVFGAKLQLVTLFQAPSVEALLPLLDAQPSRQETLDFWQEARLEAEIRPQAGQVAFSGVPGKVLLTGATGFLGAFVVDELLQQTDAQICCLIRAENEAEARERLLANLQNYGVLPADPARLERLQIIVGDLIQRNFGLSAETYQQLAQEVQAVYHVAAWVNWIYPYQALKAANVEGTIEVLRFAVQGTLKPVHHVSSTAVFDVPTYPESSLPAEDFDLASLDYSEGMLTGYAISKWVAEQLVLEARRRGIPTSIYRAAYVAGHSQTGACNTGDFIYRMTKGCIELGLVPDIHVQLNIAPVDFVAEGLVRLSLSQAAGTFHVVNSETSFWQEIIGWMGTLGYPLSKVHYDRWISKIAATPENALYPLVPYLPEDFHAPEDGSAQGRLVDSTLTTSLLQQEGVTCPTANAELLQVYHRFMVHKGFLQDAVTPA
ncbi:type I polyketide synthase [Deinococcus roseus]|uniref:Polyketide synthase n=1 Tax=Deinococcus roseus TaxID=392414 RepID=A0ABQ2DBR7_9DEIO|nr:type I polyketide synthase [Deinococcus roseus]GGJ52783.1 hypothetical protein GCM10008938_43450 [Deinococcus roseus]